MKNIRNNTWYILSKTWKYEKRLIIIILFQIMIGVILPLATAVLPAWIVDAIGNGMNHITIARLAVVIILLMICNTAVTYIASIQETYLLNSKMGFLSSLLRKEMEIDYAYAESPEGQNKFQNAFMSIVNDYQGIPGMLSLIAPLIGNILSLTVNVFIIIEFNVWIVVVLTVTAVVHFWIATKIRKKQDALRDSMADSSRKLEYIYEYMSGNASTREIKIFDMQKWIVDVLNNVTQIRIGLARKSAGFNFSLSFRKYRIHSGIL